MCVTFSFHLFFILLNYRRFFFDGVNSLEVKKNFYSFAF